MRGTGNAVLLLDAGDLFGPADSVGELDARLKCEYLIRGMDMMGYDSVTLGEQDFRFGESFLNKQLTGAKLKATSANIYTLADNKLLLASYFRKQVAGLTVVVVGIADKTHDKTIRSTTKSAGKEITLKDHAAAQKEAFSQAGAADLRILLTHMDWSTAQTLAKTIKGVDIMIVAHDFQSATAPVNVGGILVVSTGYWGEYIDRVDVTANKQDSRLAFKSTSTMLDSRFKDDAAIAAMYKAYLAELKTRANEIIAKIPQKDHVGGTFLGSQKCQSCHAKQYKQWLTTKHAKGFDSLTSSNHAYDPSCYSCHAVGFGYKSGFLLPDKTPTLKNIQCESCHGAGSKHVASPKTVKMQKAASLCATCHSKERSPQYDEKVYLPKVKH